MNCKPQLENYISTLFNGGNVCAMVAVIKDRHELIFIGKKVI